MENLKELFESYKRKVLEIMPYAEFEHVGGSAIPGLETKGDLDMQIRVEAEEFEKAVKSCDSIFTRRYEELWNNEFALFKDSTQDIKTDIMVTVKNSAYDSFYAIRDAMIKDPSLLQRYIELKKQYPSFLSDEYRKAKHLFFRQVEAELGLKVRPLESFPKKL